MPSDLDLPPGKLADIRPRSFFAKLWRLTAPYWRSADWKLAWLLLVAVIALNLGLVGLDVIFNFVNRDIFDALGNKDASAFWSQVGKFCLLVVPYILIAVYYRYLLQMLMMRWRRWMTQRLLERWLSQRVYYLLQLGDYGTDNPEQRIEQDISAFTNSTLSLTMDLINSVVTLFSFVFILWTVSGAISFTVSGHTFSIPGYMVWVAVIYAAVGSYFTYLLGKPLVGINFMQERYNASFRFSMTRLRENAESIAFYRGENDEKQRLDAAFDKVWRNWFELMRRTKRLGWLTSFYAQAAVIFPLIVAAPRYFAGAIPLGTLTQIGDAFGSVQGALSWFIGAFSSLADWKASVNRLIAFIDAIETAEQEAAHMSAALTSIGTQTDLTADLTAISLPTGERLLQDVHFDIQPGQRVLISGPSGSGKTTLFRTLAGLWPFTAGQLSQAADSMFLPQRPYLPIATLRDALSFPAGKEAFSTQALTEVLAALNLSHLVTRLDETDNWSLVLSGGEQQRVAIARAILMQPDWLFLDEATSALDEPTEQAIYQLLIAKLPQTSVISIAHRESLAKYHDTRLTIDPARQQVNLTTLAPTH